MIMLSNETYHVKIYGFGEIYEDISVNRALRRITRKYGKPMKVLIISRCGEENIRRSEKEGEAYRGHFLEFVPCDNPLWECHFKYGGNPIDKHRPPFLLDVTRLVFHILCPLFEWKRDPNLAHGKIGVLDL